MWWTGEGTNQPITMSHATVLFSRSYTLAISGQGINPLAQARSDRCLQVTTLRITPCWIDNLLISGSLGRSFDASIAFSYFKQGSGIVCVNVWGRLSVFKAKFKKIN